MLQVNVARLHDDNREALALAWIAGREGGTAVRREAAQAASVIGHLNLTHPNSIQVIGAYEAGTVAGHVERLFEAHPSAVIVADGVMPPQALIEAAARTHTPLFTSPAPAPRVIEVLARYLAKALAESTERHGVLMDVLGLGVLITGESGVGKSELGLELISRGHGLVADDIVEISRIAVNTLEGRCPPMLKDFLEVRGLGLLNIRTIFGETAVRRKMKLRLVAHLERQAMGRDPTERLPLAALSEDILGVTIGKVIIPVAAGRNLAVLVEAAVRNQILKLRGIDSMAEFLARQSQAMHHAGRGRPVMQLILVSGLSGSGKSIALNVLEDAGYYCVDNLPATLLLEVVDFLADAGHDKAAISVDARSAALAALPEHVAALKARGVDCRVLYLEAGTPSLLRRFSETRRRHPLAGANLSLAEAIEHERTLLARRGGARAPHRHQRAAAARAAELDPGPRSASAP